MKKLYLQLVCFILSLIILFGFVLPFLFSAASDFAVIMGVVIVLAYGYALLVFLPKIYKNFLTLISGKNENE